MNYSENSIDIFRKVVEAMTFPISIKSVSKSGKEYTLKVCNIYHSQPGFEVTIGGKKYVIVDYSDETTLIVKEDSSLEKNYPPTIAATSFDLYKPYFFHGTPIGTEEQLVKIDDASKKTPMVWMLENYIDEPYDEFSAFEKDVNAKWFFLTQCDPEQMQSPELNHNCIKPMERLAQEFLKKLNNLPARFYMDEYRPQFITHSKFGVYITNKGVQKSMFNDKLSGVELDKPIIVNKDYKCPDGCN